VVNVFAIVFSLAILVIAFKLKPFLAPKRRIKVIGIAGIMGIVILAISLVFTRTKYPNELLFNGLPVTRFLEMTRDDVIWEAGELRTTHNNGSELYRYPGGGYITIFYNNDNGKIIFVYIYISNSDLTFNRRDLSRITQRMIMRLLPYHTLRMSTNLRDPSLSWHELISELQGMYRFNGRRDFDFLRSSIHGYTLDLGLGAGRDLFSSWVYLYADEWNWSLVE
jgi:hypothetical protein